MSNTEFKERLQAQLNTWSEQVIPENSRKGSQRYSMNNNSSEEEVVEVSAINGIGTRKSKKRM